MNEPKIVYMYNWKDLIYIIKKSNGEWYYEFSPKKVVEHLNEVFPDKEEYQPGYINWLKVGLVAGAKIKNLLIYCEESEKERL